MPAWWLFSALCLLTALALMHVRPAQAAGEVKVDAGGTVVESEDAGDGMPASNPRVRPILAAHPDQYVVVCVAGCNGKSRAVQVLPRTSTARVGGYTPSVGKMGREVYGPPSPSKVAKKAAAQPDDVVCVAGCNRAPGQVVQRVTGLPPLSKGAAKQQDSAGSDVNRLLDLVP